MRGFGVEHEDRVDIYIKFLCIPKQLSDAPARIQEYAHNESLHRPISPKTDQNL